jgi:hypothetical protein
MRVRDSTKTHSVENFLAVNYATILDFRKYALSKLIELLEERGKMAWLWPPSLDNAMSNFNRFRF